MESKSMLQLQNISKSYRVGSNKLEVLKGVDLEIAAGEMVAVMGPSGSGMVLEVPVEEGDSVIEANTFNEGTTIAIIADMDEMIFEGKVDESEVGGLSEGMELLLTVGALETEEFHATLEYISPKGVEEDGAIQFEIRAALELEENLFVRANYSANADIVLDRRDEVLAIQESWLQFDDQGPFVEIETGDQEFEKRRVETGLSDGIQIEIVSGISESDRIKDPNSGTVKQA